MTLHTIYTTYEVTDENDNCLLEIPIRICFTKSKYYPATRFDPPEGGELEIYSIEMEDTPNKWQILTPDDDLYAWAIDWFDDNDQILTPDDDLYAWAIDWFDDNDHLAHDVAGYEYDNEY